MSADYSRIHRLLQIITLIQAETGWDVKRLALECGTTERNIYRDLEVIKEAGVPAFHDRDTGGYRIRRDFFMPPVELTLEESLGLLALGKVVSEQEQLPFSKPAAKALAKLRSQLPVAVRKVLDELDQHVAVQLARTGPHDGVKDVYDKLQHALTTRTALRCQYDSLSKSEADTDAFFIFKPYALFFSQRAWYAVGYHGTRDAIRTLKLNRFTGVELTDQAYEIPHSFSMHNHLGNAWRMIPDAVSYDVKLCFDSSFAETIEDTTWHATQQTEPQPDGTLIFTCKVDGLKEIVWWILSMGPHCRVLEPPELVTQVQKLAAQTAALYAPAGQSSIAAAGR